jgi:hypothetical protein
MSLTAQGLNSVNAVSAPVLNGISHGLMFAPTTSALSNAAQRLDHTFFNITNASTYESMANQGMWNLVNMFSHRHAQMI